MPAYRQTQTFTSRLRGRVASSYERNAQHFGWGQSPLCARFGHCSRCRAPITIAVGRAFRRTFGGSHEEINQSILYRSLDRCRTPSSCQSVVAARCPSHNCHVPKLSRQNGVDSSGSERHRYLWRTPRVTWFYNRVVRSNSLATGTSEPRGEIAPLPRWSEVWIWRIRAYRPTSAPRPIPDIAPTEGLRGTRYSGAVRSVSPSNAAGLPHNP